MTFRVGQKVVYVNDEIVPEWTRTKFGHDLIVGEIYTIREIFEYRNAPGHTVLRVSGIINPIGWNGVETGYLAWRFRPLVERKTDISIFTAMLKTERQPLLTD